MIANHRRDEPQPGVGGVDAHHVDAVKDEAERTAERDRLVDGVDELGANGGPELGCLGVALRGLDPTNNTDGGLDKADAAIPAVSVLGRLLGDEVDVEDLNHHASLAGPGKILERVSNLREDAGDASVARRLDLEVVGERIPKGLCGICGSECDQHENKRKITHRVESIPDRTKTVALAGVGVAELEEL